MASSSRRVHSRMLCSYVYFNRNPSQFSKSVLEKTTAAKLKLEHHYRKAVEEAIERNQRLVARGVRLPRESLKHSCVQETRTRKEGRQRSHAVGRAQTAPARQPRPDRVVFSSST